jgi:hypothetical protein
MPEYRSRAYLQYACAHLRKCVVASELGKEPERRFYGLPGFLYRRNSLITESEHYESQRREKGHEQGRPAWCNAVAPLMQLSHYPYDLHCGFDAS